MARLGASTEGGNVQQQYGILGGKTWSSGNLLAAYDYSRSSAILAGDRSYAIANNPETTLVPKTWRHSILISGHPTIGPDLSLAFDDRKSVGEGKSVSVRVDIDGRHTIKKKKKQ